ncbi:DUF4349 domain-containing protein [Oscillatoria sp. FACHB-1407]|uniref:DUF4349 domain-containing protein n=1 Tax=Oscillatoria sp. FACHB-1407 TaxID=2692847 RepID=UPI0016870C6E|nr:DUF4349 domain-containing protein [Oscillatoria sp. FACHB-1407]MBD2460604.1 DUF4349 domain-containing protein [Oscillatoria sp. FACHB-1407]
MNRAHPIRFQPALVFTALLGGLVLSSCGAPVPMSESGSSVQQQTVGEAAPAAADAPVDNSVVAAATEVPRSLPQLIKTAELSIAVDSVEKSIDAATAIAAQQRGDVLGLQDNSPTDSRQNAYMQLRVPQEKLEATLNALAGLGTVQRQSIMAEDVSNQLVDFQARLRNLQKTEEMLLDIMERSGSVGDVLKVAQELSNVRNSIEQIDAQLKDLQNRVAYSTINLNLEGAIASNSPDRTVGTQLGETWQRSTQSLRELTVDLLQLGIWLMVYSPYLLVIAGIAYGYKRLKHRKQAIAPEQSIAD